MRFFPPAQWLAEYRAPWLPGDIVAGVTLAAYAIPVSLAYAGLAGLPPQAGIYGYLLGGLGYALLGSSRQLAIGPTSAISLMIAGTVGAMAEGDAQRYAQIASLAGFTVAALCLIAWLLRLSVLVKLISDSILVGFKAGAGLTIAMTQLPSLFGVAGGGHNFFERVVAARRATRPDALPRAGNRRRRDHAAHVRRARAAGKTGRARRRRAVDRRCLRAWASRAWGADDGRDPGRLAQSGRPCAAAARRRGHCSAGRRLPAARLYRKRFRRPHLCGKARIYSRPAAGASRYRRGKSRSRAGPRLSGGGRPVAIGGERQGRRAHAARAGLCLDHAGAVPALPDGLPGKPAEGGAGRGGADRGIRPAGFSGAAPHVASEPAGFLRRSDRSCRGAASRHPARHPARCSWLPC